MQNRYFGDVGDFGKYGLLRALSGYWPEAPALRLGVAWYLVPDEGHNDDGRHISYLMKPEYRTCDPELHDTLRRLLIEDGHPRKVDLVSRHGLLPPTTSYAARPLDYANAQSSMGRNRREGRLAYRAVWLEDTLARCADSDIVFLDPDNGFEVASTPKHAPKAPKYVYWDEFDRFANLGKTLVVYHHLNRTRPALDQVAAKTSEIRKRSPDLPEPIALLFRRGSLRCFFLLPAPAHHALIDFRLKRMLAGAWSAHFERISS